MDYRALRKLIESLTVNRILCTNEVNNVKHIEEGTKPKVPIRKREIVTKFAAVDVQDSVA